MVNKPEQGALPPQRKSRVHPCKRRRLVLQLPGCTQLQLLLQLLFNDYASIFHSVQHPAITVSRVYRDHAQPTVPDCLHSPPPRRRSPRLFIFLLNPRSRCASRLPLCLSRSLSSCMFLFIVAVSTVANGRVLEMFFSSVRRSAVFSGIRDPIPWV